MIVSKAFAKLKKLKPVVYVNIKGENNGTFCILNDNKVKGKELIQDDEDIFGKRIQVRGVNKLFLSFDPAAKNIKNMSDDGIRSVHYIVGSSGAGKTTYAAKLAEEYRNCYPDNDIIFISSKPPSTDFKKLRPTVINVIDPERSKFNWVDPETKIQLIHGESSGFDNSLTIIDDIEAIVDKEVKKSVEELINQLLSVGRARNASIFYLKHDACDHKKTKTILIETHFITVFRDDLNGRNFKYLLESYAGLNKKQIDYLKDNHSRVLTVSLKYPKSLITEDELYIF